VLARNERITNAACHFHNRPCDNCSSATSRSKEASHGGFVAEHPGLFASVAASNAYWRVELMVKILLM
jgi:hypothetical protein